MQKKKKALKKSFYLRGGPKKIFPPPPLDGDPVSFPILGAPAPNFFKGKQKIQGVVF